MGFPQSAQICGPPILCGFCDLCGQILFFVVFVPFVVKPFSNCCGDAIVVGEAHPAKPERLSDVLILRGFYIALRAYAPRLRSGHRRLSFASATYFEF